MKTKEILGTLDGQECWTNAFSERFGERVCIGVEGNMVYRNGEKFKPTPKEIKELWADYIEQELGTQTQRIREIEEEFGWTRTASIDELMRKGGFSLKGATKIFNRNKRGEQECLYTK